MRQKKIRFVVVSGLMLIISLFFLSGCKSTELQAIEDSASVLQITKGREAERYITDKGVTLGKPVDAKILIVYEPINNHARKEVYEEIVAILKKNNWQGKEPFADYFVATLQQGGFEISAKVSIDEIKDIITISMAIH
jgi:hypothetical protein